MVTIISGANEATSQLAGQTIGAVRAAFAVPLNIGAGHPATVNGRPEPDGYVLRENDRLVFNRNTAEKGIYPQKRLDRLATESRARVISSRLSVFHQPQHRRPAPCRPS